MGITSALGVGRVHEALQAILTDKPISVIHRGALKNLRCIVRPRILSGYK